MSEVRENGGMGDGTDTPSVTETTSALVLERPLHWHWLIAFGVSGALVLFLVYAGGVLFLIGVGVWGINIPVVWAFDIINYVWWIGIANAASLLAASLVLLRRQWRATINRLAEAVALFAALCAAILPILHLGRPWLFYWVFPYPNTMDIWPQFRSALTWDFFGILAHLLVVFLFWYVGLLPDLATLRDRAKSTFARTAFGLAALGWRGSSRQWQAFRATYALMAALVVALLVFMQSIVALEFAVTLVPVWHGTILPPHFVAGAVVSGVGAILVVALPLRTALGIEALITRDHLDVMGRILLGAALVVVYAEAMMILTAWTSGDGDALRALDNRLFGPYGWAYWTAAAGIGVVTQALWFAPVRRSPPAIFAVALAAAAGMWFDRFSLLVGPIHRDFLVSSSAMYQPTVWELALLLGTLGIFFTLLLLFIRLLPVVSMYELRKLAEGRRLS